PALAKVCNEIVVLAEQNFRKAREIMAQNSRRVVRAPRIMGEGYHVILEGLVARGFAPPRQRVRLPRVRLLFIVLRNLV
ncbi:MAG: squalene synthase HpnD, partial [Hyphomicrobiales bacterium]|nr:squalene synthase HpnD [Hyphomicrobiales bacterium]